MQCRRPSQQPVAEAAWFRHGDRSRYISIATERRCCKGLLRVKEKYGHSIPGGSASDGAFPNYLSHDHHTRVKALLAQKRVWKEGRTEGKEIQSLPCSSHCSCLLMLTLFLFSINQKSQTIIKIHQTYIILPSMCAVPTGAWHRFRQLVCSEHGLVRGSTIPRH